MIEATLMGGSRLGNQLFSYAVCRSIAEKNGYQFFINKDTWLGEQLFNVNFGGREGSEIVREWKETELSYDPKIWDIEDGTRLVGYFQSEKYFDHDKARKWFKLWPDKEAEVLLQQYPIENTVYINLRGTDVKDLGVQKLSIEYYRNAIAVMQTINPNFKYVVVTDDVPFGREYFPDFHVMTNSVRTDFTLLNRAKYVILADSSFSWWAAWLNEKNFVVAPHGWLNVNINKWLFSPKDIKVNRFVWV